VKIALSQLQLLMTILEEKQHMSILDKFPTAILATFIITIIVCLAFLIGGIIFAVLMKE
jgi:hypothetical protein